MTKVRILRMDAGRFLASLSACARHHGDVLENTTRIHPHDPHPQTPYQHIKEQLT
jgi:hypothetical protein